MASRFEDDHQELKGSLPSSNRNSWIYNPTTTPPSGIKSQDTSIVKSSLHDHAASTSTAGNSGIALKEQVGAAVEILSGVGFVEGVRLLREKNQLSREEAMRLLYNAFYAGDKQLSDRQTWSEHRQQHPPATILTPEPPSTQHSLQLRAKSPDRAGNPVNTLSRIFSSSTYPSSNDVSLKATKKRQNLPLSPSTPTFPSEQMEAATRTIRGATFSNAYKTDGTALDQNFASQLNLYGSGTVGDGHQPLNDGSVERLPYNPTASTFTPTGPRHMISRSMNTNFVGYGTVPEGLFPGFSRTVGATTGWLGKGSESKPKSPTAVDINDHDDSGLGFTPPRAQQNLPLGGVPVPASLNQGGTDQKRFVPMNAALKENMCSTRAPALYLNPTMQPLPRTNFSERYLGQHTESNASANISEDYNCAIWVRNLPPNVSYRELLGSIKGAGRVWCSYINMPDYVKHHTAAAKVVFYRPESARAFLQFVSTQHPEIRGFLVRADLNRIKSAPHSHIEETSRVLIITGEDWFAEEIYLKEWFGQQCQFQTDQVVTHIKAHGRAVIEFRFGSYRSQAEAGFKALTINRPRGFQKVEFGDDPCEVGETLSARAIALQRFQGIGL